MAGRIVKHGSVFLAISFLFLFVLCTKQQKETPTSKVLDNFVGIPDTLRELQQEGNEYYVEEDCFCSRRILLMDKSAKTIKVYSWCAFQKSPEAAPDLGSFKFSKSTEGRYLFQKTVRQDDDPDSCIALTIMKADTMTAVESCDRIAKHIFVRIGLVKNYSKRVQDCSDVEG